MVVERDAFVFGSALRVCDAGLAGSSAVLFDICGAGVGLGYADVFIAGAFIGDGALDALHVEAGGFSVDRGAVSILEAGDAESRLQVAGGLTWYRSAVSVLGAGSAGMGFEFASGRIRLQAFAIFEAQRTAGIVPAGRPGSVFCAVSVADALHAAGFEAHGVLGASGVCAGH